MRLSAIRFILSQIKPSRKGRVPYTLEQAGRSAERLCMAKKVPYTLKQTGRSAEWLRMARRVPYTLKQAAAGQLSQDSLRL